jgi:GNAT superfamily N-acetyltransferase
MPQHSTATIRTAGPDDHPTIREILRAAYAQYTGAVPAAVWDAFLTDILDLDRHARHGQLLVAVVDGDIVGYAAFYPDASAQGVGWPPGWAGGRGLAVRPGHRGHGIAPRLLAEIERRALAGGATAFAFHTSSFMTTAVALYDRLGYCRVPHFDLDLTAFYGVAATPRWTGLAYLHPLSAAAAA